jgi:hypothetical protein
MRKMLKFGLHPAHFSANFSGEALNPGIPRSKVVDHDQRRD